MNSLAHEWIGPNKPNAGDVKCIRCGQITKVGQWDIPRCAPHGVKESSGWKREQFGQGSR